MAFKEGVGQCHGVESKQSLTPQGMCMRTVGAFLWVMLLAC